MADRFFLAGAAAFMLLFFHQDIAAELIACGSQEVRIYDVSKSPPTELWRWSSADAHVGLLDVYRHGLLDHIDECKPVMHGHAILTTSSTGATVIIDVPSGQVRFYAQTPMAHSAEWLPGNRVVVADSLAEKGNRLEVYDVSRSQAPLFNVDLHAAHGVIWWPATQTLYAVGDQDIRSYSLSDWASAHPGLKETGRWPLPTKNGHDLSPIPGEKAFVVSTDEKVWRFDLSDHRYAPFAQLHDHAGVKAVSINPRTGRIAYQQAHEKWWSHRAELRLPVGYIPMGKDMRLYKVRWLLPATADLTNRFKMWPVQDSESAHVRR